MVKTFLSLVTGSRPDHHAVKRDSDYHIKRELAYHDGKREPGHHDMKRDPGYHDVKREPGHHERREPGYHERPGRESGGGGAHPAGRGEYGLHQVKLENPAKRHPHALGAQVRGNCCLSNSSWDNGVVGVMSTWDGQS